jgi:cysteine synthase
LHTVVGNTPIVKLRKLVAPTDADVYVKLEYFTPTGSYKDRMALSMIEEAEKRGALRPGMTVVEYTGGSTGSSLAFVCAAKGYAFHVVSSDAFSAEKLNTMRAFGATLEIVHSPTGKNTPGLVPAMMARAKEIASTPMHYATDQFNNRDMLVGYAALGNEILAQLSAPPDYFCGSVGTGGMLMGVAQALRAKGAQTKVVALEPASTPVLSGGAPGTHGIDGIGSGFVPPLFDRSMVHEVRAIEEADARAMCLRMAREEGIFAGTSSGLNVVAALKLARELGAGHSVVTVACDSGLKYLSGPLYAAQPAS